MPEDVNCFALFPFLTLSTNFLRIISFFENHWVEEIRSYFLKFRKFSQFQKQCS